MQRQKYKEKINSARKSRKSLEDILLMINFAAKYKYRILQALWVKVEKRHQSTPF